MNQAKINELYERAHVVHEIRYEGSVVDPTIVSVHKQRVFDRNLFAELIVRECAERLLNDAKLTDIQTTRCVASIKEHFGVDTSC